jgi:hypothetical protein
MHTRLAIPFLLAALAVPPAYAGGWGHHHDEDRRGPPPPPQQQYRPLLQLHVGPLLGPPRPQYPPQYQQPYRQQYPYPQYGPQYAPQYAPQYQGLSRDQAMQRAQQMNGGGRILAADPAENGYLVRVLKDGEVRSVYVPAQ